MILAQQIRILASHSRSTVNTMQQHILIKTVIIVTQVAQDSPDFCCSTVCPLNISHKPRALLRKQKLEKQQEYFIFPECLLQITSRVIIFVSKKGQALYPRVEALKHHG